MFLHTPQDIMVSEPVTGWNMTVVPLRPVVASKVVFAWLVLVPEGVPNENPPEAAVVGGANEFHPDMVMAWSWNLNLEPAKIWNLKVRTENWETELLVVQTFVVNNARENSKTFSVKIAIWSVRTIQIFKTEKNLRNCSIYLRFPFSHVFIHRHQRLRIQRCHPWLLLSSF